MVFLVQLVALLYLKLPGLPTPAEFYATAVTAAFATFAFFGLNKVNAPKAKTEPPVPFMPGDDINEPKNPS